MKKRKELLEKCVALNSDYIEKKKKKKKKKKGTILKRNNLTLF